MVSGVGVVDAMRDCRVGGLSASMYFRTVARLTPNFRAIPRMDMPLRFAFCIAFHPAEAPSGQRPQEGQPQGTGPENSPPLLPNESARPSSSRESRRRQTWYLPWPTLVRGQRGGSAWPGGLRFGRRGYSEHRMLLVAGLPLHCTAPRQLRILPLLTRGTASQHSLSDGQFSTMPATDGSSALACRMVG